MASGRQYNPRYQAFGPEDPLGASRSNIHATGEQEPGYDAEKAHQIAPRATPPLDRPGSSRNVNWDLFSGLRNLEHSYVDFDTRNAAEAHLVYADGDIPKDKCSKFYHFLLNISIVTRWFLYIVPILGVLWIPGILALTKFPNARVWDVKLLWWSIWLSVLWGGWWAALAFARFLPIIFRGSVGVVAIGTRRYIDWLYVLYRYVALFAWTLAVWISWNPLIDRRVDSASAASANAIHLVGRLLFVFFLCAAILLFEKFSIQWIAGKFHERSYAERIADQRFAVRSLVTLYRYSTDSSRQIDESRPPLSGNSSTLYPTYIFKEALKQFKTAATATTSALGNVASEIAGSSVLQPNSPQAIVKTALESANKSRLLARRLFHSFVKRGADHLVPEDIAKFFPTPEDAAMVFALFDRDSNGDVTRDELEMVCTDLHREQLSLEHSMQDLDSAVGRLDNILMTVHLFVVMILLAVALNTQITTLLTGAGATILALSWLIGGSLQEVLVSIIFLFVKHPFDVGDRINVNKTDYTVKEMRLLSTVLLETNGTLVQAPNVVLNTMFIQNMRRSPQMSESFTFDVEYSTTFEQLEALRRKMIVFLENERRDFLPAFDVTVVDFPDQTKLSLRTDIKYKSNWQQGALKAQRRNKWMCALKSALAQVKIFGPGGNPQAKPEPTRHTLVPWEEVQAEENTVKQGDSSNSADAQNRRLYDNNVTMHNTAEVFNEDKEKTHTADIQKSTERQEAQDTPIVTTADAIHPGSNPEIIEMKTRS